MGEIPLEVKVVVDGVVQEQETFYAYTCIECVKLFLLEDIIEQVPCPYCGGKRVYLLEDYT